MPDPPVPDPDRGADAARRLDPFARLSAPTPGPELGTALRGVRADRGSLREFMATTGQEPAWWDGSRGRLALIDADLRGADLEDADLSGADLTRTCLAGSRGRSARFDECILEATDFTQSDLSGARFKSVSAGQVLFRDAMLEDAVFADASMRFAKLTRASLDGADFTGADLWGADFSGSDADDTSFRRARLDEADLSDANLTQADFEGATLKKARFARSRLRGVNFTDVKIEGADLCDADLSEAKLVRLNLVGCKLRHAKFAGAWIEGTRMRVEQLGGAVGEEIAGNYEGARLSYLALEQNFKSIGSHEEATWSYRRGRRMGRLHAGSLARTAWAARDRTTLLREGSRWATDRFVEWLCDYGVSMSRIARAFGIVTVLFALGYGLTGGLILDEGARLPTYNPLDWLTYSGLNILTSNPPDIGIKPVGRITNLLVGVEGATGIILMGLFGFVLGSRLRR